jgi:hypothetical protein
MKDFGKRLEELLVEKDSSRGEVAEAVKVSETTVGNWIKGKKRRKKKSDIESEEVPENQTSLKMGRDKFKPRGETLMLLCNYLGVNSNWLLTGEGPKYIHEIEEHHNNMTLKEKLDFVTREEFDDLKEQVAFLRQVVRSKL